jgi:uncharacterized protein YutE (UPF0331/DUF86 family)
MSPIDPVRVRDLLGKMAEAQRLLGELGRLSESEFLGDYRNTESAKYLLIVATESAIDICNHIVSHQGGQAPRDYADCFAVLAEVGAVSPDLAENLKRMARFRNLLVHVYWKVDNRQVYEIIRDELSDLDEFRRQVIGSMGM